MLIETVVALFAAVSAHSVALAAFGADSGIELFSAATVLWRFRSARQHAEVTASKITAWLLVALAVYIAADSAYRSLGRKNMDQVYSRSALFVLVGSC